MNWTRFLILALPVAICAQDARAATLAQLQARGYLVAGVVDAASPFGGVVDGKAAGFDAALIDGLGKSASIPIRQQPVAPDEIESALGSGKVDIIASSIEITAPRQDAMRFASPVAEATRYYLKRRGDGATRTLADLAGKRFGSRTSSSGLPELTEFEHRLAKAGGAIGEETEYPTYREAAKALIDKRIDYVIGDIADLSIAVRDNPNEVEIGEAVSQKVYVAWATAQDSPEIAALVSGFVAQARKTGALQALQQKYLGQAIPDLPETVDAKDWWLARDKPKVFPIPTIKDPD